MNGLADMNTALITPDIIVWAKQRQGISDERIARSIDVRPERILDWITGTSHPTLRQAQKLARTLRIPFGYLYLERPPERDQPIPDRRTVTVQNRRPLSADFEDLLASLIRKQDWYRDYLRAEGIPRLPFVGSSSVTDSAADVATSIRETLHLREFPASGVSSRADLVSRLSSAAEAVGIVVIRSGIVGNNTRRGLDVQEFRGLALSDPLAPLIFVNSADAKAAQAFTIVHELAHLWIDSSGVSNVDGATEQDDSVERFCNAAAAEVLVPAADFTGRFRSFSVDAVRALSDRYRVSTLVIARRALELNLISRPEFFRFLDERNGEDRPVAPTKPGGDFRRSLVARNSRILTDALIGSVAAGKTLYREGASVLDVRVATFEKLVAERISRA